MLLSPVYGEELLRGHWAGQRPPRQSKVGILQPLASTPSLPPGPPQITVLTSLIITLCCDILVSASSVRIPVITISEEKGHELFIPGKLAIPRL